MKGNISCQKEYFNKDLCGGDTARIPVTIRTMFDLI